MQVSQCFSTFRGSRLHRGKRVNSQVRRPRKRLYSRFSLYISKGFDLLLGPIKVLELKNYLFTLNNTYLRHRNCHILSLPWTKSCAAFRFNFYQKVLMAILRFRGFVLGIAGLFLHTNFSNLGAMCFPQGKGENMAPKVLKVRTPK